MFDPAPGRFITRDPIGLAGGQANLYVYCGNNPVNATDPSGLQEVPKVRPAPSQGVVGVRLRADGTYEIVGTPANQKELEELLETKALLERLNKPRVEELQEQQAVAKATKLVAQAVNLEKTIDQRWRAVQKKKDSINERAKQPLSIIGSKDPTFVAALTGLMTKTVQTVEKPTSRIPGVAIVTVSALLVADSIKNIRDAIALSAAADELAELSKELKNLLPEVEEIGKLVLQQEKLWNMVKDLVPPVTLEPKPVPKPKLDPEPEPEPQKPKPKTDTDTKEVKPKPCFAAGTRLMTPTGFKAIEQFQVGDKVLSCLESIPGGSLEAKVVEAVFAGTSKIVHLHVNGKIIKTTGEHPFYAQDKGWVSANQLEVTDLLLGNGGEWVRVEGVRDTGEWVRVYNLRIADYQTYFVGGDDWSFTVWAHNACIVVRQWRTIPSKLGGIDVNHYTIEIATDSIGSINTDLEGQNTTPPTPAKVGKFTASEEAVLYRVGHNWMMQIDDKKAVILFRYVQSRLRIPSGDYNAFFNSCACYVWDVLNEARLNGVVIPALPAKRPYPPEGGDDRREMVQRARELYDYLGRATGYTSLKAPKGAPE